MFCGRFSVDEDSLISRRRFIFAAAIATGGAAAGLQLYRSKLMNPGEQAVNDMLERLSRLPGAIRFGEMFRKQLPQHNKPDVSVKTISDRLYKTKEYLQGDIIDEALENQIQIELRSNQVYLVDDWYLTRTEAELCALASLIIVSPE
jgi:hypothetical protein